MSQDAMIVEDFNWISGFPPPALLSGERARYTIQVTPSG
jgi:hypothetical protein